MLTLSSGSAGNGAGGETSDVPGCCVFCSPRALIFEYGCTVHVGVDVGAGDAEGDVIYI